jgi:hypothetical protein
VAKRMRRAVVAVMPGLGVGCERTKSARPVPPPHPPPRDGRPLPRPHGLPLAAHPPGHGLATADLRLLAIGPDAGDSHERGSDPADAGRRGAVNAVEQCQWESVQSCQQLTAGSLIYTTELMARDRSPNRETNQET